MNHLKKFNESWYKDFFVKRQLEKSHVINRDLLSDVLNDISDNTNLNINLVVGDINPQIALKYNILTSLFCLHLASCKLLITRPMWSEENIFPNAIFDIFKRALQYYYEETGINIYFFCLKETYEGFFTFTKTDKDGKVYNQIKTKYSQRNQLSIYFSPHTPNSITKYKLLDRADYIFFNKDGEIK